jgi:hypothetical protein
VTLPNELDRLIGETNFRGYGAALDREIMLKQLERLRPCLTS